MEIDGKEFGKSAVADLPQWALLAGAFGIGAAGLYAYLREKGGEFTIERLSQRLDAIEQISAALLDVLSEEGWSKSRGAVVAASLMGILEIARGSAAEVKKLTDEVAKLHSLRAKLKASDAHLGQARRILLECRDVSDSKKRLPVALRRQIGELLDVLNKERLEAHLKKMRAEQKAEAESEG